MISINSLSLRLNYIPDAHILFSDLAEYNLAHLLNTLSSRHKLAVYLLVVLFKHLLDIAPCVRLRELQRGALEDEFKRPELLLEHLLLDLQLIRLVVVLALVQAEVDKLLRNLSHDLLALGLEAFRVEVRLMHDDLLGCVVSGGAVLVGGCTPPSDDHLCRLADILLLSRFLLTGRLSNLLIVFVLSVLNELLHLAARLFIGRVIDQVLQHVVLLLAHDLLALEETVEELLQLYTALVHEIFRLRAKGLFRRESRELLEDLDGEALLDK